MPFINVQFHQCLYCIKKYVFCKENVCRLLCCFYYNPIGKIEIQFSPSGVYPILIIAINKYNLNAKVIRSQFSRKLPTNKFYFAFSTYFLTQNHSAVSPVGQVTQHSSLCWKMKYDRAMRRVNRPDMDMIDCIRLRDVFTSRPAKLSFRREFWLILSIVRVHGIP